MVDGIPEGDIAPPTPPKAFISNKISIIVTYKTFIGLLSSLGPYFLSFIH